MDGQVTALKVTSKRNINIDLLRALVMFFILAEHLIVNGLFNHDYATNHVVKAMSLVLLIMLALKYSRLFAVYLSIVLY